MCPDDELLSAYYDDELDPVWERRIGQHVSSCQSCTNKLALFARLSEDLQEVNEPDFETSKRRVWLSIERSTNRVHVSFWNRRISVPVPAIAGIAAAFAVLVGVGLLMTTQGRQVSPVVQPLTTAAPQQDIAPVRFQVNNLNDLMSYLDSKDFGNNVTIQLPKEADQLSIGKPQLIRAADFKRGQ